MSPTDAAKYAWWALRHPGSLRGVLQGATLRDLVLREDLRHLGFDVPIQSARGLGKADASAPLVARLHHRLARLGPRTVLDVGAQYGRFARAALLAFPGTRVYCFEPLKKSFERLSIAVEGWPEIRAFQCALGRADEVALFHRSRNPGSSSLLAMLESHRQAFPGTEVDSESSVRVRRLDDLVRDGEILLKRPVLLKIDVQGFEDRVLDGAPDTLNLVDAIIMEMSLIPLYEGQVLFAPLRERLERDGFEYCGEFDQVLSPVTGEACQVDGLFLRSGHRDEVAVLPRPKE